MLPVVPRSFGFARLTLVCSARGDPVTVMVGKEADSCKSFFPKELLLQHSDFAKAALSGGWKESKEQVIRFKVESPTLVEIFATFVYTGKIYSAREGDTVETGTESDSEWQRLAECWILGDVLQSCSFRDAITDAIIDKRLAGAMSPAGLHHAVYKAATGENGFKRLVVDMAAFGWGKDLFEQQKAADTAEAQFFRDVCVRLLDRLSDDEAYHPGEAEDEAEEESESETEDGTDGDSEDGSEEGSEDASESEYKDDRGCEQFPWINAGCKYHDHGTDEPCYKTMF